MLARITASVLLLGFAFFANAADEERRPDRIVLENGSTIIGFVTDTSDGVVSVKTDFAGTLKIDQASILSMQTHKPVTLQLADGTVIESQTFAVENEQLVLEPGAATQRYALDDLLRINPEPWELGRGYNNTGLASVAFAMQRGNTDTDELDYKAESRWVSLVDRYTMKLVGEIDEANGVKNADNWRVTGKYDRFLENDYYFGVNAMVEQDEFADLDLRYSLGPYIGKKFFSEPVLTLEAEVGMSYVVEDFIVDDAQDDEYIGATWSVDATSNYLGGDSRLYLQHNGIWDLEKGDEMILNTTFGLGFPLLGRIEGAAEVVLEYNSGAVDSVEELDQTYRFRVGYNW